MRSKIIVALNSLRFFHFLIKYRVTSESISRQDKPPHIAQLPVPSSGHSALITPTCQSFLTRCVQKINFRTQILRSHCCSLKYCNLLSRCGEGRPRLSGLTKVARQSRRGRPQRISIVLKSHTIDITCFGCCRIVALCLPIHVVA